MPRVTVSVTTTGSAGSATGAANTPPIWGYIKSVAIDYHASAPNTTTVDLDEVGGNARKILDKAGSATDVAHYPSEQMQDNTGSAITGMYRDFYIDGRPITVTLAASNALTGAAVVTIEVDGHVGVQ
jgi:hypothetical protein